MKWNRNFHKTKLNWAKAHQWNNFIRLLFTSNDMHEIQSVACSVGKKVHIITLNNSITLCSKNFFSHITIYAVYFQVFRCCLVSSSYLMNIRFEACFISNAGDFSFMYSAAHFWYVALGVAVDFISNTRFSIKLISPEVSFLCVQSNRCVFFSFNF